MKLIILGSGGKFRIPKACCDCEICNEARTKGAPFERLGTGFYLEDESILFDTSEDINLQLNKFNIKKVNQIFYSHWHPDHTGGYRILEVLNGKLNISFNKRDPLLVNVPVGSMRRFEEKIPNFFFYEKSGVIKVNTLIDPVIINNIKITTIPLSVSDVACFLIEKENKKILLVPCHCNFLNITEEMKNADALIMNLGHMDELEGDLEQNKTSFKHNLNLIRELSPKQTILTHIEEDWKKSYEDFKNIEDDYKEINLKFGYDGMGIFV